MINRAAIAIWFFLIGFASCMLIIVSEERLPLVMGIFVMSWWGLFELLNPKEP